MDFRDPFVSARNQYSETQAVARDQGLRSYMLRIYNYMASALALTGIVALLVANSEAAMSLLYTQTGDRIGMSGLGWVVAFAPIGLVLWLSFGIHRMSTQMAQGIYWIYAALVGASLSSVFLLYTGESIARTFFVTAGTFGAMSLYGYTTKRDLTGMGSFLLMGLFGVIIASVVNIFLQSSALSFVTTLLGLFIFIGLVAYDTQKLREIYYQVEGSAEGLAKATIMGALNLYLDFINIFMHLLRFMGERR